MREEAEVLALDSLEWSKLDHAYGPAGNIPDLLRDLERQPRKLTDDYREEPWFTLWSSLCHQDDVYPASYAATPHITRICRETDEPVAFDFFLLPAAIEIARANGRGPAIAPELSGAYFASLKVLHECALKQARHDWDEAMARSVAAALAAAKGQIRVANAIMDMDGRLMNMIISGELD